MRQVDMTRLDLSMGTATKMRRKPCTAVSHNSIPDESVVDTELEWPEPYGVSTTGLKHLPDPEGYWGMN